MNVITYTQVLGIDGQVDPNVILAQDGDLIVWIPNDDGNKDWQEYTVWVNEGNVPNDPNGNPKTDYVLPPSRNVRTLPPMMPLPPIGA